MASDSGEKTEPATPKRRQDARKKGQTARSPELSGAVALLALLVTFRATLGNGVLTDYLRNALGTFARHAWSAGESGNSLAPVARAGREGMLALVGVIGLPILVAAAAGALACVAQVGFLFTPQPLVPDVNRLNPAAGLSRLLGTRGLVDLAKAVVKLLVVGLVVYATLRGRLPELIALATLPTGPLLASLGSILYALCLRVVVTFCLIAVADYAYQRWEFEKSIKMSKEEIKREHKQSEGDPLIKAAIRQRQREAARKRMMQDVPKADVVITNPSHFAVALAYDAAASGGMAAPRVLAKGQDAIAARIRAIAREAGVPLVADPPLARALHKTVEIGQEIPAALYAAVAAVLAYVYQRNGTQRGV